MKYIFIFILSIFSLSLNAQNLSIGKIKDTILSKGTDTLKPNQLPVRLITGLSYTPTNFDYIIEGDCVTNCVTITLPDPKLYEGKLFIIIRCDTPYNSEHLLIIRTINDIYHPIILMNNYQKKCFVSDGNNWIDVEINTLL